MRNLENEVDELRRELREMSAVVVRLQNYIRIGANYQNEDLERRVFGLQAALLEAAKVEARRARRQNGKKHHE